MNPKKKSSKKKSRSGQGPGPSTPAPPAKRSTENAPSPRPLWLRVLGKRHVLPLLILVATHAGVFDGVFGNEPLLLGSGTDILSAQIPYRTAAMRRLSHLELPLWEPGSFGGLPLLANGQSGAAYPPFWLLLPFSPERAVSLSFVLHLLLAGVGAYFLTDRLRRRGVSARRPPPESWWHAPMEQAGPLLAGLCVSWGGSLLPHIYAGHVNYIEAAAWVPFVLLAIDKAIAAPGLRPTLLLALVVALQILAGHPQVVFLTALAALLWIAVTWPRRGNAKAMAAGALGLAGAAVLAVLASAVFLLPSLEMASHSQRLLVTDPVAFAAGYSAPGASLLQLVLPHPFGAVAGDSVRYWPEFSAWEAQSWVGPLVLLLAALALVARPRRERWALVAITGLGLFLALGVHTPIYEAFVATVPGAGMFRVPARFFLLAGVALPVLAGLGLDALMRDPLGRRLRWGAAAAVGALGLGVLTVRLMSTAADGLGSALLEAHAGGRVAALLEQGAGAADGAREAASAALTGGADQTLLFLALGAAVLLFLVFHRGSSAPDDRGRTSGGLRSVVALLLLVLAGSQAILFSRPYVRTAADDPRPPLSDSFVGRVRELAGSDRVVWWEDRRWNAGMQAPGLRNAGGYDPALSWRLNDVLNLPRLQRALQRGEIGGSDEAVPDWRRKLWVLWPSPRGGRPDRAWDLLAGKVVIARNPLKGAQQLRQVARPNEWGMPYAVYENATAFPRFGLSPAAVVAEEELSDLRLLAAPDYDPRRALVFDTAPDPLLENPGGAVLQQRVQVSEDSPERLVVEVEAERPAYLWVADAWLPGWEAQLDGRETPLLRANHAFRAVAVPAGAHTVTMEFRPPSVLAGGWLSLLGALAMVALAVFAWLRRKKKAPTAEATPATSAA